MLSPPQSNHGDSYPNCEYDHSDITPKVTPSATHYCHHPPRIKNDDDNENEDNTHEEEVRVAIGSLVKYCFNNDESCYHLRSLLTSICKEYDLHLAVGPRTTAAAERHHTTIQLTPAATSDTATQTDRPAARRYAEASTETDPAAHAPPPPPTHTYAEAAAQTMPPPPPATTIPQPKDPKGKGKAIGSTDRRRRNPPLRPNPPHHQPNHHRGGLLYYTGPPRSTNQVKCAGGLRRTTRASPS